MQNKMKYLLGVIFIIMGLSSYGRKTDKPENGIYYSESGSTWFEIKNDTLLFKSFLFTEKEHTLAICKITRIDNNFFEINSIGGSIFDFFKGISVTEEPSEDKNISTITFDVPNADSRVQFDILYYFKTYSAITENGKCTININHSKYTTDCHFWLRPIQYNQSNVEGQFFGVLQYEYPIDLDLKGGKNIVVRLPGVTDLMFEQFYLTGEYVQIVRGGVKWNGKVYKRSKAKRAPGMRFRN